MNTENPTNLIINESLWDAKDVAQFLNVSVGAVRNIVYRRQLPFLKIGRRCRFYPSKVRLWAKEKEVKVFEPSEKTTKKNKSKTHSKKSELKNSPNLSEEIITKPFDSNTNIKDIKNVE